MARVALSTEMKDKLVSPPSLSPLRGTASRAAAGRVITPLCLLLLCQRGWLSHTTESPAVLGAKKKEQEGEEREEAYSQGKIIMGIKVV